MCTALFQLMDVADLDVVQEPAGLVQRDAFTANGFENLSHKRAAENAKRLEVTMPLAATSGRLWDWILVLPLPVALVCLRWNLARVEQTS